MMKKTVILLAALALCAGAFAKGTKKDAPKKPSMFKFYGFVRTYFAFDTRESSAGTEDFYFYMPKDRALNEEGEDMNAIPSFRFASLTSRLGVDLLDVEVGKYAIGGKIEADFYAGLSGNTGTAQFRLRQAYVTLSRDSRTWKIGQAWHPMAVDLPDIFSLESGAPFGPFSRTPMVAFDWRATKVFSLSAAALWQMQYTSVGPSLTKGATEYNYATTSASADYIKYSCIPEFYLGANFKFGSNIVKVGADVLSIKPRKYDYDLQTGKALNTMKDRITTWSVFQYGQFVMGDFTLKEKLTYANDGSHMNLVGGYGATSIDGADGSWEYAASRVLAGWMTLQYKKKDCNWVPSVLLGYSRSLGTPKDIVPGYFWYKNSASTLGSLVRIQPEIIYNLGKLAFGLEYMATLATFGTPDSRMLAATDLHTVVNHRVQVMVKYSF
ncbi:MAG: DcaP family trimeric outer membrane transporter [Bacteroidales bacterium]|nr:DcaP family trimeric outer membrane transporter [Bacteroidales bacterium]